ncbi:uncharacterized protein LOC132551114 [Ylistrum balloti]|uniref:uncharacterized protein LOC132551114 n=1 Tax=Ylistrum balloti TaxID=509963 RepID=UPI002905BA3B|nr:uncharacterized protein LOC132551114 [Ylistrum balloti]
MDESIPFVGRRRDCEEIKVWFRQGRHRLIQVYGPPFTGKQRLAQKIKDDLAEECRERGLPLRCIGTSGEYTRDWNDWLDELVIASGDQSRQDNSSERCITNHIRLMTNDNQFSRILFVFTKVDNVICTPILQEQFIMFCQKILQISRKIFILVTSQKRIMYPSSLSKRAVFLAGVTESDGVLLLQNVAQRHADIKIHSRDIVRGCCYLPGLIVEAAMLLDNPQHVVSVDDLVAIVQSPGSLMKILSFHRQRLQYFFDRMSENMKKGAMLLTLFQGSFSKEAATEVLLQSKTTGQSPYVSLIELCDQSVVSKCMQSDRYEVNAFFHCHMLENIQDVTELNSGRLQFTKFFCRTLQDIDHRVYVHGRENVLNHLHADFDNVRQLMQQTMHCTEEIFPLLMQVVVSAEEVFTVCFSNQEVERFYESLMAAASVFGTARERALILWLMAQNSNPYGKDKANNMDVLELCKAAVRILHLEGPSYHLAAIKGLMGQTYNRIGNARNGHRLLSEALAMLAGIERSVMVTRREVALLSHLAISEVYLENHSNSERTVDRGLHIACRETPHHPAIAVMLNTMGLMWENSGRSHVNALQYYKWSLKERRKHSYFKEENLVPALLNVSLQFVRTGRYSDALSNLEEAMEIRKRFGWINHFTAVTLWYSGVVYMQLGNFSRALDTIQQAFKILEMCTPQHPAIFGVGAGIAHCHLAMKDEYNARRAFSQIIAKYHTIKTDDVSVKIGALRHCLLLGDSHQRKNTFLCLQRELLDITDTNLNIEQQISECRDIYLANEEENWNENGRILLSKHCSLCQNGYRVFSYCENAACDKNLTATQMQSSGSFDKDLKKTHRQPSESVDKDLDETERQLAESVEKDLVETERQLAESVDKDLTETQRQPSESVYKDLTETRRQPSESADKDLTKIQRQLSESVDTDYAKTQRRLVGWVYKDLIETRRQPSESVDKDLVETERQLAESVDKDLVETERQLAESVDKDLTEIQRQPSESVYKDLTETRRQPSESADKDLTKIQRQLSESVDTVMQRRKDGW